MRCVASSRPPRECSAGSRQFRARHQQRQRPTCSRSPRRKDRQPSAHRVPALPAVSLLTPMAIRFLLERARIRNKAMRISGGSLVRCQRACRSKRQAHKIQLKGDSMRKARGKAGGQTLRLAARYRGHGLGELNAATARRTVSGASKRCRAVVEVFHAFWTCEPTTLPQAVGRIVHQTQVGAIWVAQAALRRPASSRPDATRASAIRSGTLANLFQSCVAVVTRELTQAFSCAQSVRAITTFRQMPRDHLA